MHHMREASQPAMGRLAETQAEAMWKRDWKVDREAGHGETGQNGHTSRWPALILWGAGRLVQGGWTV